jgi:cell division protein FtsZ
MVTKKLKKLKKLNTRLSKKKKIRKINSVKYSGKKKEMQKKNFSQKIERAKKVKNIKKIKKTGKIKKIIKRNPVKKTSKMSVDRRTKTPKKILKNETIQKRKLNKNSVFKDDFHKTKIRLIGIGGGGGSIVSELALKMNKLDFVVANTDVQALKKAPKKIKKFQFGQDLTDGFGAGMNPEIGKLAAENKKEEIKKLFEGQDVCILIASLGGGTGSGALPVFSRISKNLNCITYGIFTLPFEFEGEKKMEISRESLEQVKQNLNAYSIIPNERIFRIVDKNAPLKTALSSINRRLTENLQGLIEMIYSSGLINIDFADLKTILSGKGKLVYLNTVEAQTLNNIRANNGNDFKDSKIPENDSFYNFENHTTRTNDTISTFSSQINTETGIIKKLIFSELYPYDIKGAKGILYNISSDKALQLLEVSLISEAISELINKKAKIIFGINQNEKLKNRIKITLLAVGCNLKKDSTEVKTDNDKIIVKKKKPKKKNKRNKKVNIVKDSSSEIKIVKIPLKEKDIIKHERIEEPEGNQKQKVKIKKLPAIKKSEVLPKKLEKETKQNSKPKSDLNKEVVSEKKDNPETKNILPKTRYALTEEEKKKSLIELTEIESRKVRRSGLQVREATEEEEKEILKKEEVWETPAIFRRKKEQI